MKIDLSTPSVQGEGPLSAKVWIVGELATREEIKTGRPFAGKSGMFLKSKLNNCGANPKDIRFECLGNGLRARIRESKPNIVVICGEGTIREILNQRVISKWRGHILWNEDLDCKVMATYLPSVALRQRYVPKANNPGQYETLMRADLQKAIDNSGTRENILDQYECVTRPTFSEAVDILEMLQAEADIISYDIESLIGTNIIDCIGLAKDKKVGYCIPFWVPHGKGQIEDYWDDPWEFAEILRLVQKLLQSSIPKVAQNAQFDDVMLAHHLGIRVRNLVCDTMVLASDLYCDLPKDLGCLIGLYTNFPYHKYLLGEGGLQNRWDYNAADAIANIAVMEGELKEAKELGILEHYRMIPNLALDALTTMHLTGVKVDIPVRDEALETEEIILEKILETMDQIFPESIAKDKKYEHKIKLTSPDDRKALFYGILGLKKVYAKGALTTGDLALTKFKQHDKAFVRVLAEIVGIFIKTSSMVSKLKTPLLNGRIHTAYGIGGKEEHGEKDLGTNTGRLGSKKSLLLAKDPESGKYVAAGTNLQNLKKGTQRRMVIPG